MFLLWIPAFALASAAANAQTNMRIRSTITGFDGKILSVKSRDGRDLTLQFPESGTVAAARAIALADLKPGDYAGVTSLRKDGVLTAGAYVFIAAQAAADGTLTALRIQASRDGVKPRQ